MPTLTRTVIDRVSDVLRDTADTLVMPAFRSLRPEDITAKDTPGDPEDVVTVTDMAVERHLVNTLAEVIPGAGFIGEESACENPAILDALSGTLPVWVIDPIDGTKNFARGKRQFGVMVALVESGSTVASWIALPASGDIVFAHRAAGTWINGDAVQTSRVHRRPRGTVHDRLMPRVTASRVNECLDNHYDRHPSTGSAATEYTAILRGEKDFVIYFRLLPWDHAAGALALVEAGGAAIHVDGRTYSPRSADQVTIFAATPDVAAALRASLYSGLL